MLLVCICPRDKCVSFLFHSMKRTVSVHGTQGFNIWNAQSQAMEGEKESTKMLDFPICYVCKVTSLLVPLHSF